MEKTVDRRIMRTRTALRAALIALLRRRSYDEITVQEIIDEANVGRSTFYAHCSGKDELLRLSLRMLHAELADAQQAEGLRRAGAGLLFSLSVLEHIREHRDLYPALAHGHGRELLMKELRRAVSDLVRAEISGAAEAMGIPLAVSVAYVAGAFMAVLEWWIDHKTRLAPAEVDAMFQALSRRGAHMPERSSPIAPRPGPHGA